MSATPVEDVIREKVHHHTTTTTTESKAIAMAMT